MVPNVKITVLKSKVHINSHHTMVTNGKITAATERNAHYRTSHNGKVSAATEQNANHLTSNNGPKH